MVNTERGIAWLVFAVCLAALVLIAFACRDTGSYMIIRPRGTVSSTPVEFSAAGRVSPGVNLSGLLTIPVTDCDHLEG